MQLSELAERRRAQRLRKQTRLSGRSGKRRMCEERAQGNGAATVRVMRHRTRARRGGGIPPTKYRAADGGCSAREESRFSPKGETNACAVSSAPEGAMRGFDLGRSRYPPKRSGVAVGDVNQGCGTLLGEADCTGLDPEAVYVYGERVEGRARRPPQRASTVAPTVTAHWKAKHTGQPTRHAADAL